MNIKISEITKIIQQKIKNYKFQYENPDLGVVISVADGIAIVQGLDDVKYLEVVNFDCGAVGLAFSLEEDHVGVIILNNANDVRENDKVQRTKEIIAVPVGDNFLGRIIEPLGDPLDGGKKIVSDKKEIIEKIAPSIMVRESVNEPLETGILAIDSLLPIGKGQRELIIGDRQTGKTSVVLDAIINQKDKDVLCIYVAIGQKNSDVLNIVEKLKANQALNNTIVITAGASDSDALKYIAPFVGMTHAEYFLSKGKDVLIVFDDLSKHANAYRGLSLLLRRTPGRQAYPGDIFYLHSRLLERAVKLNDENGGGSITALPIIETQLEDLTAYIPTNVISITDGQIFLLQELFNLGFKPAVDFGLSVSRVGSSAQIPAIKKTVGSLKLDLAKFKELQVFARFGGNLDENTTKILQRGSKIIEILKQKEGKPLPQWISSWILLAIKKDLIASIPLLKIDDFKKKLIVHCETLKEKKIKWVLDFIKRKDLNDTDETQILKELKQIIKNINLLKNPK